MSHSTISPLLNKRRAPLGAAPTSRNLPSPAGAASTSPSEAGSSRSGTCMRWRTPVSPAG
jgi:hypothetical protein